MSALGHKRTYAARKVMSALPPIATANADSHKAKCHVRFTLNSGQFRPSRSDLPVGSRRLRPRWRPSIRLVGHAHEGGEFAVETRGILIEWRVADAVVD